MKKAVSFETVDPDPNIKVIALPGETTGLPPKEELTKIVDTFVDGSGVGIIFQTVDFNQGGGHMGESHHAHLKDGKLIVDITPIEKIMEFDGVRVDPSPSRRH